MTQSTSNELQPLVEQCYNTLLSCFPPEMHDAELFKTLRLQALQQVLATERDASSQPPAAMQAPDLTTLTHAVQQLPRAAAREVSSHIASSRMDLTTINNGYLTMATAKWLKSTISPLSLSEVIPSPRSLNSWWPQVIRALSQIHESVMPEYLSKLAIQTLAPYILGDAAWQMVAQKFEQSSVANWNSFCSIVESDFGVSETRQRRQFLLSAPLPNETAAAFIKRMEVSRAQLQCEGETCVVAFFNKLPATFQQKVEQVRLSRASYGQEELTWELIVLIAKDELSGAGVADPTPSPTSSAPSASAPRAVTAPQPQATRSSSPQPPHVRVLPRPPCPLCSQIGVEKAFHNLDGCYLNPKGRSFRQDAYDRKVAYLTRNNIALPEAMKMPPPPFATPSLPFHPTTPAKAEMNASFDNLDAFEKYIRSIGLPDSTIQECLAVYKEHNTPCEGQHMIMDLGDGVDLPTQIGAGAEPEYQATYMDQLLMSQKDARQQQRDQTYSDLVAAVQKVTQRLEQIAAGQPTEADGSIPMEDDDDVPLAQVQRQLQQVQRRLANASVQTGGVGGRRIKLGREGNLKVPPQLDNKKIAERIKLSMPLLRATITDSTLRELILCQLISLNIKEGKAVVMPDGAIIHQVNQATFDTYRTELEGVSASNIGDVTARLSQMGLDGRGNVRLGNALPAVASQQSFMPAPYTAPPADKPAISSIVAQFSELASTLESLLCPTANSSDQAVPLQGNFLAAASLTPPSPSEQPPLPPFADKSAINMQGRIGYQATQFIATVQIGDAITEAMLDTGGHASIIDLGSAEAYGLTVQRAVNANYGHYHSPGYKPRAYAGIVEGPVPIRFSTEVVLHIPFLRVIESERPLLILGADLLCGGRASQFWNFTSILVNTSADEQVTGFITFRRDTHTAQVPLVNVPRITPRLPPTTAPFTTAVGKQRALQLAKANVTFHDQVKMRTYQPDEVYDLRQDQAEVRRAKADFIEVMQKIASRAAQQKGGQCL